MDASFLELFGQMLIQAAKGQRQMDQFSNWRKQGFNAANLPGFNDYFQRLYGLKNIAKESDQYGKLSQKAQADFLTAYGEFMGVMGLVPEKKYEALQQEFEALEKKCQAQEKMMTQLKAKLGKSKSPSDDLTDQLTDLIEQQRSEFSNTIKALSSIFDPNKKA